ncbi:hypothetical protein BpHYR1_050067 [Brachionus plicatilis]|uniref:Ras-associating domain-containing protein n=1 Tax=Brachionus plicatilis TaxID=10195 RepID=A0A3M7PPX4_BRAPC|nr:hypothetical protein BpHYR1_050067 [Brachionus plicatilis]
MNILQKVLNKKSCIKPSVRIGSNRLNISVDKNSTCKQFLINCLKKCKINVINSPNGYNLFLKYGQNEKLVMYESNLYLLLTHLVQSETDFELLIRRCQKVKINRIKKNRNLKLKRTKKYDITFRSATHYYEDIDVDLPKPQLNITRTISNPKINKLWPKSIIHNMKAIHRIREKFKSKTIDFDQEIFV